MTKMVTSMARGFFTPTLDNLGTFGQADSVSYPEPQHGDFVLDQFIDKLSPEVADNSHIILVDIDFGDDLFALTQSNYSQVLNDIYASFAWPKPVDTLLPVYGITASFGGGYGPGTSADELNYIATGPGAILQASANVNQGGYNWSSDPNYNYVITVGAWNTNHDGLSMGTEDYLKNEIDLYADGWVADLFGNSGFGTSYATPAVAAEVFNFLFEQTDGLSFSSVAEHQQYLFDVVSPGSSIDDQGNPFSLTQSKYNSFDAWTGEIIDAITSNVKVNFTDGTHEVVKILTSDIEEGHLQPSTVHGYNGEYNYWGPNKIVSSYELVSSAPVQTAPIITSSPLTSAIEETQYSYQVDAYDPDPGTVLHFSAHDLPSWLTLDSSTGLLTGMPDDEDVGEHQIYLAVTDRVSGNCNTKFSNYGCKRE